MDSEKMNPIWQSIPNYMEGDTMGKMEYKVNVEIPHKWTMEIIGALGDRLSKEIGFDAMQSIIRNTMKRCVLNERIEQKKGMRELPSVPK